MPEKLDEMKTVTRVIDNESRTAAFIRARFTGINTRIVPLLFLKNKSVPGRAT